MVNGWLILDKPLGITSAQAVERVKRLLGRGQKIGHGGTLDPLASGILPIALGEATKTVQFAMDKRKSYRFTVTWGEARSTDDGEGEITATSEKQPTQAEILAILPRFTGKILQAPPAYSAIKLDGKRAYALARAGEAVEIPPREVEVFSLTYHPSSSGLTRGSLPVTGEERGPRVRPEDDEFVATCGKGTYIRSLARDMALALGTVGHVSALRRTSVGNFLEKDAISLETLADMVHKGCASSGVLPVESVLDDIPAREIDSHQAACLRHGQAVSLSEPIEPGGLIRARHAGKLLALCSQEAEWMKPVRVFNL